MRAAEAALAGATAQRDLARQDNDRAEKLAPRGTITRARLDQTRAALETAKQQALSAQADLENARAALVSRGLAEMMRLAVAEGGRAETVMGLSGAGDLILTAMSATSRNTSFGIALGEGRSAQSTLSQRSAVTEGYWTAQAVVALAARAGIEMPIAQAVNAILGGDVDIDAAIGQLLERPVTVEF